MFSTIHDVADPQTTMNTSFSFLTSIWLFQKYSKDDTSFERGVSIQGISSMNTTLRPAGAAATSSESRANASSQLASLGHFRYPYCTSEARNASS